MSRPAPNLTLSAFQCGPRQFTLDEVLAAARELGTFATFRGAWQRHQVAARLAATAGLTPTDAELEAALETFRYARDLVSGEECDRWLETRGLRFDDLVDCITRRLQSGLIEAEPAVAVETEDPTDAAGDDERLLRVDALLADEFNVWARRLARAVALAEHAAQAHAGAPLPPEAWAELDRRREATAATLATPARRRSALAAHRLELTRVRFEQAEFDTEGAAREAILCAREDATSLRATAETNAFPCQESDVLLGDLPAAWAEVLMSARLGEAVIPRSEDGSFVVLSPLSRQEPSLDDPAVQARVDAAVVEHHFRELETRYIRWLINVDLNP